MKKYLLIITGKRKEVFIKSFVINNIINLIKLESESCSVYIVTERSNYDIFENINAFQNKLYALTPKTFLILMNQDFDKIFDITSPTDDFGKSLISNFKKKYKNSIFSLEEFLFPEKDYYFEEITHPLDIIHSKIRRDNKFLIGINIGEDEDVSKKLPISTLNRFINKINNLLDSRFVLFGTMRNITRLNTILRSNTADFINMIGLTNAHVLAQAIGLCDIFISLDSFMMHLSVVINQATIGLFAYTDPYKTKNFDNLIKYESLFRKREQCKHCNDEKEGCPILYSIENEDNCLYHFPINQIIKTTSEIMAKI